MSALADLAGWSSTPADLDVSNQAAALAIAPHATEEDAAALLYSLAAQLAATRGAKAQGRAIAAEKAAGRLAGRALVEWVEDAREDVAALVVVGALPSTTERDRGYAYRFDGYTWTPATDRPGTLADVFAEVLGCAGVTILAPTGRVVMRNAGALSARAALRDLPRRPGNGRALAARRRAAAAAN